MEIKLRLYIFRLSGAEIRKETFCGLNFLKFLNGSWLSLCHTAQFWGLVFGIYIILDWRLSHILYCFPCTHTCLSHWTTTLHEDGMMLGVPVSQGLSIHRPLEFPYSNFSGIQMGRAAYKDVYSKEVDKWGFGGEQAC